MATWLELRCEMREETFADGDYDGRCWSHDNRGPMDMADDNRASLLETIRAMEEAGRSIGWKKTREGWVCPFCVSAGAQP